MKRSVAQTEALADEAVRRWAQDAKAQRLSVAFGAGVQMGFHPSTGQSARAGAPDEEWAEAQEAGWHLGDQLQRLANDAAIAYGVKKTRRPT